MSRCGRHAVVLEASRRVLAFVLKKQSAGLHLTLSRQQIILLQNRLAFADRDDLLIRGEPQQLAKSPDPAVVDWIQSCCPATFELSQRLRNRDLVPVVIDVQKTSALRARRQNLAHIKRSGTIGMKTLLIRDRHEQQLEKKQRTRGPATHCSQARLQTSERPVA